jgi:uroporphyrinogen decarboxylase
MISSKQRVIAAVEHKTADRTAITFDAEKEVYELLYSHFKTSDKRILFDSLGCDTWMILPGGFSPEPTGGPDGEAVNIWGVEYIDAHYSGGVYQEIHKSPLAGRDSLSDIDNWQRPGADAVKFDHFRGEAAANSDRAVIGVFTHGPYFIATDVRGMENLMMDFGLNRLYAARLIEKITEPCLAYLENMLENHGDGIDIVYMADDYCSQDAPLFSPADFREFVMPYLTKFVETTHKHGKKFLLHCCGAVRPLLPMIIEAGVDMLEPIQIRAAGMEPEGLKRDFGSDICFYGGVDLQQILCKGSPGQVSDEVKRLIDILGRDGGYVLGPGHTYIQIDAPLENILAMYKTAVEYRP